LNFLGVFASLREILFQVARISVPGPRFCGRTKAVAVFNQTTQPDWAMQPERDKKIQAGAIDTVDETVLAVRHCPNGHPIPEGAALCPACGTLVDGSLPAPPSAPALPQVPGYELLQELGRGGMGVVFKARHGRLNRVVALKMILAGDFATAELRQRFQREAEAVARLQHPNVVQLYEIGETDGKAFFSLELIEGPSLAERLHGTPLAAKQAARLVLVLANAVHFAHERGIVHRDLKPANILIAGPTSLSPEQWTPKITDFGLAKHLNETTQHTQTGAVLGTPSYMAPEQAQSALDRIGPATDVYALGAILYELLTGRPPFLAPTAYDTIAQVLHADPVPVRSLQGGVSRDLETVCLKCLQKEPAERYGSAHELAEDLQRFLNDEPVIARPISGLRRSWRWMRRRPAAALFLATLTVALLIGIIGATWFMLETQRFSLETQRFILEIQESRRLADRRLYVSNLRLVQRAWEDNQLDWQGELLDDVTPNATDGIDLRGFEWHFWKRINKPLLRVPVDDVAIGIAFRPDSQGIAALRNNRVTVWSFAAGSAATAWEAETEIPSKIVGSPDGRAVACCVGKEIRIRNEHGVLQFVLEGHEGQVRSVAFSGDGHWLVSAGRIGDIRLWDLQAKPVASVVLGEHGGDVINVAFSHHDSLVASVGDSDGSLKLWDSKKRTLVPGFADQLAADPSPIAVAAFSPCEPLMALGLKDGRIAVWNTDKPKVQKFQAHVKNVSTIAFSADGKHLASACSEQYGNEPVRIWTIKTDQEGTPQPGQEWTFFRGPRPPAAQVQFSSDGKMLACSGGGTLWVWKIPEHLYVRELSATGQPVYGVACSSDGKWIASTVGDHIELLERRTDKTMLAQQHEKNAFTLCVAFHPRWPLLASGADDHTVKIWDLADNKELATLKGHTTAIQGLAFHPTLRRLAAVAQDHSVRVWNLDDSKLFFLLPKESANCAVFSPDGQHLVLGRDKGVISIHDAETGAEQKQSRLSAGEKPITALAFDADGQWLASGAEDLLILWDFAARKKRRPLRGHSHPVNGLAFSPDGRRLASATNDGVLRLWDTESTEELFLWRHAGSLTSVAFNHDGSELIAGHHRRFQSGGVSLWWAPHEKRASNK
jgi:WD40 repeat protein/serine/threonine protein kinase